MSGGLKKMSEDELKTLDEAWRLEEGTLPEPLQKVLDAVEEYEQKGEFEYMARCPMADHEDNNPSLHVTWDPVERRVLLHCFGCDASFWELVEAMELTPGDLSLPGAGGKKIVATYDYCDEGGQLLYQVVRYEPKDFRQRRPDGNGGWIWDLNGARRVLYRLPELLVAKTPRVWIAEGEKDVETLRKAGYVATTSGGAKSWRSEFKEFLRGRDVVIVPDRDEAGQRYADQVAHDLFGVAASVRVLNLPCGKDVSDYIQLGGNGEQLGLYCEMEGRLVKEPPAYTARPDIVRLSDIELKEVCWLWQDRIPQAKLTLVAGEAGIGKSLLTLDIAARISTGAAWPDGRGAPEPGSVLIFTTEDGAADTVAIRLAAAGADLRKIHHVKNVFDMREAVKKASKVLEDGEPVKLIIMDPLTEYLGNKDSHKNAEVRSALAPLSEFEEKYGVAVIGITHYSKMEKVSAANKIIGSIGFNAIARQVWHVIADGSKRLFVAGKANLTGERSGLAYEIVPTTVKPKDKELSTVKIKFKPGEVYETADDVLMRLWKKPGKAQTAESWLQMQLAEGPKNKDEIEPLAEKEGFMEHTLRRARENLHVVSDFKGKGPNRKTFWRLPKE
jgi:putative DNA primase/helicase